MRRSIWKNDVDEVFNTLVRSNVERHSSEEDLWNEAYDIVNTSLDEEVANLNIATDNLFITGKISRWGGLYKVHKDLRAKNLGTGIMEVLRSFGGEENSLDVYVEEGRLFVSFSHGDTPPSLLEIREGTLTANTPCGQYAERVHGWGSAMTA